MVFRAWDGIDYQGDPPEGWYLGADERWWPPPPQPSHQPPPPPSAPPPPPSLSDRGPGVNAGLWDLDIRRPSPPDHPEVLFFREALGLPDEVLVWPMVDIVHWDLALKHQPLAVTEFGLAAMSDRVVLLRDADMLSVSLPSRR